MKLTKIQTTLILLGFATLTNAQSVDRGATRRYINVTRVALAMAVGSHAVRLVTLPKGSDSNQVNTVEVAL